MEKPIIYLLFKINDLSYIDFNKIIYSLNVSLFSILLLCKNYSKIQFSLQFIMLKRKRILLRLLEQNLYFL